MTKMVLIEYVGKKDTGEIDHLYGTNIVWAKPGDTQDVPEDKVALLLNHPDVWRDARTKAQKKAEPIEPKTEASKRFDEHDKVEPDVTAKIHLMAKEDLVRHAYINFGETLDDTKDENDLRQEVVRLMHTRG